MKKEGFWDEGVVWRYSLAFKQQVISEIELRKLTVATAAKRYDIPRRSIYNWIESFGRTNILSRVVRVESKNEKDRIKELESQNKQLESALAKTQLKVLALESLIEVAEETYKVDLKKNCGPKRSADHSNTELSGA